MCFPPEVPRKLRDPAITPPKSAGLMSAKGAVRPTLRQIDPDKDAAMKNTIRRFFDREEGAITVDWVVLSAAVIGMGMLVLVPVAFSTESSTQGVADYIENVPVGYDN